MAIPSSRANERCVRTAFSSTALSMPSVICASALFAAAGVSGVLMLVFTARTYAVQRMNVKEINGLTMFSRKAVWGSVWAVISLPRVGRNDPISVAATTGNRAEQGHVRINGGV